MASPGIIRDSQRHAAYRCVWIFAHAVFQQIDLEEYQAPHSPPVIRMYGATKEGHSVMVHVHGFLPYFFVNAPRGFTQGACTDFKNALNVSFSVILTQRQHLVPMP